MTSKRELLTQKEQELADLKRLVEILDEIEGLSTELSIEKIVKTAPQIAALTAEADRLIRKHQLSDELVETEKQFKEVFSLYTDIYHTEVKMKNDINRLLRLELRKQTRLEREEAAQAAQVTLCDGCKKKPARIYANAHAYCKRCAREEGIILRGKIV